MIRAFCRMGSGRASERGRETARRLMARTSLGLGAQHDRLVCLSERPFFAACISGAGVVSSCERPNSIMQHEGQVTDDVCSQVMQSPSQQVHAHAQARPRDAFDPLHLRTLRLISAGTIGLEYRTAAGD